MPPTHGHQQTTWKKFSRLPTSVGRVVTRAVPYSRHGAKRRVSEGDVPLHVRPRQSSSALPKGVGREDLAKVPGPTHRKTAKLNQEIAIRRQELQGGWGAAGRHLQWASPPSPGGRVRARPEKCRLGRARRSRRRRTGGAGSRQQRQLLGVQADAQRATFKTAYLPLYI